MAQNLSKTTTDHDTIREWAEARGGKPSEVEGTARGDDVGMIRIDFPGYGGAGKLREISWDEWFRKFDESNLALVYEEETSGGQRSSFNKLVGRETMKARAAGVRTSRRHPARGRRTSASRRSSGTRARRGGSRRGTTARSRSRTSGGASRKGGRTAGRSTGRSGARKKTARRSTQGRRSASRAEAARTTSRRRGTGSGSRSSSRRGTRSR